MAQSDGKTILSSPIPYLQTLSGTETENYYV